MRGSKGKKYGKTNVVETTSELEDGRAVDAGGKSISFVVPWRSMQAQRRELREKEKELAEALVPVRTHGNRHLRSDAMVAATFARACFDASRTLVDANLGMIKDGDWVDDIATRLDKHASRVDAATVT